MRVCCSRPSFILLALFVASCLTACNDLAVFTIPPQASSLSGQPEVSINEDGKLALDWQIRSKNPGSYEAYLLELDPDDKTYAFTEDGSSVKPPIKIQAFTVKASHSPSKLGTRVGESNGISMVLDGQIKSDRKYLLQFVEKKALTKKDPTVILIEAIFDTQVPSTASIEDDFIRVTWSAVLGANRYRIFGDKDFTVLLGESPINEFVMKVPQGQSFTEFYIRAFRGELAAKDSFVVKMRKSAVTIENVASTTAPGLYTIGSKLDFVVDFSKPVGVFGQAFLPLKIGKNVRKAEYVSGSGTSSFLYSYLVQEGDDTDTFLETDAVLGGDYVDVNSLSVSGALPASDKPTSLKANNKITIDGTKPTAPVSVGFNSLVTNDGTTTLSWGMSTDSHFKTYAAKLCEDSACSTNCRSEVETLNTLIDYTDLPEGLYYACVQARDTVGLTSNWISSVNPHMVDKTAPVITSVTSSKSDGSYGAGVLIPINVVFSKPVVVTSGNLIGMLLETGSTDQRVTYSSGSNSNTLTFNYIVQIGDTSADLGYWDTAALTLGGGTIKDSAGNNANLTLPTQPGTGSLMTSKALVIDTTAPPAPVISSIVGSYLTSAQSTISGTSEANAVITLKNSGTTIGTATANGSGAWTVMPSSTLSDGTYSLTATATDAASNVSPSSATVAFTVDTSAPDAPVITAQPFPTNSTTPTLSGTSEPNMTIKLYVAGTTEVGSTTSNASGNWSITSSAQAEGTYSWTAKAIDPGSRSSVASNAISGTIDTTAPTVSSVAVTQANDTYIMGDVINIVVNFSEAVNVTGTPTIAMKTSAANTLVSYSSGSGTSTLTFNYTVASGDTTAKLDYASTSALAGTIKDLAGNAAVLTLASPGATDSIGATKTIVIDAVIPTVNSVTSTTADGAYGVGNSVNVTVNFSKAVTLADGTTSVALNTTPARSATYVSGSGTTAFVYTYAITASDVSSNLNYAATSSLTTTGTIKDVSGNNAVLTLPGLATSNSLGGSRSIEIAGNSPAIALAVNTAITNAFVGTAIAPVDVNLSTGGDTTAAPDSRAMTYSCKYDTTYNDAMDSGGTDCTSLAGVSFNTTTGVLSWTPTAASAPGQASIYNFEFFVTGTSSANRSGSIYYKINLLKPFTTSNVGFDTASDYTYDNNTTISNGIISLNPLEGEDLSAASTWSQTLIRGAAFTASTGTSKQDDVSGSNGAVLNFAGAGSRILDWVPAASNLKIRVGFDLDPDPITHPNMSGTDHGQISYDQRKIEDRSYYYDGDDYNYTTAAAPTDSVSINIWVQTTQVYTTSCTAWFSGPGVITASNSASSKDYGIHYCNGYIWAGSSDGSTDTSIKTDYQINDGRWHMITFTRNSPSGSMVLYLDGQVAASATGTTGTLIGSTSKLWIGRAANAAANMGFAGYLDELMVWDIALTPDQINKIFDRQSVKNSGIIYSRVFTTDVATNPWTGIKWNSPIPQGKELPDGVSETTTDYPSIVPNLMTGIKAIYHFNEASIGTLPGGNSFKDSSGNNNDGWRIASPTLGNPGILGTALGNGIATFPNTAVATGNNSFTAGLWFRTHSTSNMRLFADGFDGLAKGFVLYINGGKLNFGICNASGIATSCSAITSNNKYNDGMWHHAAGVLDRSGNRMYLYIDGKKAAVAFSPSYTCGTLLGTSDGVDVTSCTYDVGVQNRVNIGGNWNGSTWNQGFSGYIDEAASWDRALSATEISQVYRRASSRALFQVRSCAQANCSDGVWKGPNNDTTQFISELNNNSSPTIDPATSSVKNGPPTINLADLGISVPNNKYFQYKILLENDDVNAMCDYGHGAENCSAEVSGVKPLPNHYPTTGVGVFSPNFLVANFYSLDSITYTPGPAGCSAGVKTVIGNALGTWYSYNGTSWLASDASIAQSSTDAQMNTGLPLYGAAIARGNLYMKGVLMSDGVSPCEIDAVSFSGNNNYN